MAVGNKSVNKGTIKIYDKIHTENDGILNSMSDKI